MNSGSARRRAARLPAALLFALLTFTMISTSAPAAAQSDLRYFSETGHYLRGAFRQYWERNGGLAIFGYPVTEEYYRKSDGRIVQWFQRARLELASANPVVVEQGRLGAEYTGNRIFPQTPPFTSTSQRRYFAETGHSLRGLFKTTWETRGGVRIFGLPISEEFEENIGGQWLLVQYFERARFELRLYPSRVTFGLLGETMAPAQLRDPWPPGIAPPGPLSEDGLPKPPFSVRPGAGVAAARIVPDIGRRGTEFRIEGEGFQPGERVLFLLIAPDLSVTQADGLPLADVNGSISYASVKIDSRRFADGIWQIVAQGITSGRYALARFTVGSAPAQPGPQPGVNVRVVPNIVLVGQTFTIQGEGFLGGEKVSLWLTAPDGSVRGIEATPEAQRNSGSITPANVRITTDVGFRPGTWYVTAQGRESGRQAIGSFRIDAPGPTQGGGGDPSRLGAILHDRLRPNGDGAIVPLAAPPGATFTFTANGFDGGEDISVYATPPNGRATTVAGAQVTRDGRGGVRVVFRLSDLTEGTWAITAEGRNTRRVVWAPFQVTRDFVAPPGTQRPATSRNAAVTPAEGGQRANFRLSATGFRANEVLEFWITSPDGLYVLSSQARADSRGRIGYAPTLAVNFGPQNPAGVYGYHYRGTASGVRADIYFTYTGAP